jgi:hypothetical protein
MTGAMTRKKKMRKENFKKKNLQLTKNETHFSFFFFFFFFFKFKTVIKRYDLNQLENELDDFSTSRAPSKSP